MNLYLIFVIKISNKGEDELFNLIKILITLSLDFCVFGYLKNDLKVNIINMHYHI